MLQREQQEAGLRDWSSALVARLGALNEEVATMATSHEARNAELQAKVNALVSQSREQVWS